MTVLPTINMCVKEKGAADADSWSEDFNPNTYFRDPAMFVGMDANDIANHLLNHFNSNLRGNEVKRTLLSAEFVQETN